MANIVIPTFGGEIPRTSPTLLGVTQAMSAVNCQLQRGALEPLRSPLFLETAIGLSELKSLYKHSTDGWLFFEKDVRVVKSAILDLEGEKMIGHVLMTGDREYPTQYLAGGTIARLGIPRPDIAPKVELQGGSGDIQRSSSYCYTYIRELSDGIIKQESAPSPPSAILDVLDDGSCIISGIELPVIESHGVTHIRIYRTVSGLTTSDFRYITELAIADIIGKSYADAVHDNAVSSEILQTSLWDPIPDEAQGLIKTDNGLYAAFRGNELLISEPFIAYAFPSVYRLTTEYPIIALAHVDGTIVVLTKGRPYLAQGSSPESLNLIHLPIEQACISAKSVATLSGGVIYASPDGLMLFSSAEQQVLTGQTFTREQWQAMKPESIMGTVHDGRYVAFFEGTNKGFILTLSARDIVRIELPETWKVTALYHHSEDDCIYMGIQDSASVASCGVYRFEAGEKMTFRWKSKLFYLSRLTGMSAIKILGEQDAQNNVSVSIYAGQDTKTVRQKIEIKDLRTKRINALRAEQFWNLEISGQCAVYEARLGASIEGVEYA